MPIFHSSSDLDMHYVVDDFTDPWTHPESVLLLHEHQEGASRKPVFHPRATPESHLKILGFLIWIVSWRPSFSFQEWRGVAFLLPPFKPFLK